MTRERTLRAVAPESGTTKDLREPPSPTSVDVAMASKAWEAGWMVPPDVRIDSFVVPVVEARQGDGGFAEVTK